MELQRSPIQAADACRCKSSQMEKSTDELPDVAAV